VTVARTDLTEFDQPYRGKVRDVYDLGNGRLLSVASDRISVFDVVLLDPIPGKGAVLTSMTKSWFESLEDLGVTHHLLWDEEAKELIANVEQSHPELVGHCLVWRKTEPIVIEFIVRRYITGSLLRAYKASPDGKVWGIGFPADLKDGDDIVGEMIFTPTTKVRDGHDQSLTYEEYEAAMVGWFGEKAGQRLAHDLNVLSLNLGEWAYEHCQKADIVLADSKFEFGVAPGEQAANGLPRIIVIDEIFTPDSSRFWPAKEWEKGNLVSLDKQFVRDYVLVEAEKEGLKQGTPEFDTFVAQLELPLAIIEQTAERYQEICRILTAN